MANKTITGFPPPENPDGPKKELKPLGGSKAPYVWLTPAHMVKRYGFSKSFWYILRKNSEHFVGGGTELMVWVGAAVPTGKMRC